MDMDQDLEKEANEKILASPTGIVEQYYENTTPHSVGSGRRSTTKRATQRAASSSREHISFDLFKSRKRSHVSTSPRHFTVPGIRSLSKSTSQNAEQAAAEEEQEQEDLLSPKI